jgi:hypothetical protein
LLDGKEGVDGSSPSEGLKERIRPACTYDGCRSDVIEPSHRGRGLAHGVVLGVARNDHLTPHDAAQLIKLHSGRFHAATPMTGRFKTRRREPTYGLFTC